MKTLVRRRQGRAAMNTRLHVLLVEDSESDAELTILLLTTAGYDVVHERVETAGEMQAALDRQAWDIVLADYRLPQFDAPAALRLLQRTGLDIPFIVVSGTVGEETAVAVMKAGAHDYLMKDNLTRLAPAVRRELAEAQTRRERRQAEEALRRSNLELQARTEELDAFAHTVAHDLKSPLTLIIGYADLLDQESQIFCEAEMRSTQHAIALTARKMNTIIDALLLLAGVRQMAVEMAPLDMAQIFAEAQQRLTNVIQEHRAEIVTPAVWPTAYGYAPWVEEVWVNYLSNAIKYGGQPPHIRLGADLKADGQVRFWASDQGPGITASARTGLFAPFCRLDHTNTNGYGLGLSIVRRIVERLGGRVGVESAGVAGQGSTFFFTLPSNV